MIQVRVDEKLRLMYIIIKNKKLVNFVRSDKKHE